MMSSITKNQSVIKKRKKEKKEKKKKKKRKKRKCAAIGCERN